MKKYENITDQNGALIVGAEALEDLQTAMVNRDPEPYARLLAHLLGRDDFPDALQKLNDALMITSPSRHGLSDDERRIAHESHETFYGSVSTDLLEEYVRDQIDPDGNGRIREEDFDVYRERISKMDCTDGLQSYTSRYLMNTIDKLGKELDIIKAQNPTSKAFNDAADPKQPEACPAAKRGPFHTGEIKFTVGTGFSS